jgi:hypothetical protein
MDIVAEAARLRTEAEARPLKLPVNRRIDERHHLVTGDGLSVWFTVQLSPRRRILEAVFEREGARPGDEECRAWLRELLPDREPVEVPGLPDAHVRRFEVFEPVPALDYRPVPTKPPRGARVPGP